MRYRFCPCPLPSPKARGFARRLSLLLCGRWRCAGNSAGQWVCCRQNGSRTRVRFLGRLKDCFRRKTLPTARHSAGIRLKPARGFCPSGGRVPKSPCRWTYTQRECPKSPRIPKPAPCRRPKVCRRVWPPQSPAACGRWGQSKYNPPFSACRDGRFCRAPTLCRR